MVSTKSIKIKKDFGMPIVHHAAKLILIWLYPLDNTLNIGTLMYELKEVFVSLTPPKFS